MSRSVTIPGAAPQTRTPAGTPRCAGPAAGRQGSALRGINGHHMGVHNVTHLQKTTSFPFPIVWAESQADIHGKDVLGEADRESGGLKRRGGPPLRLALSLLLRPGSGAMAQSPPEETPGRRCRQESGTEGLQLRQGKGAEQVLPELWQRVGARPGCEDRPFMAQVTAQTVGLRACSAASGERERALAAGSEVGQAAGDLTPAPSRGAGGAGP